MQRRDDSSLHSHSHSSMNNNIWYGADDAPGVIDVDISSSVAMLDYSYYNDNSAEYTSDGSGGKIEYVYVYDDDDISDGISSNYRLDDDDEEEEKKRKKKKKAPRLLLLSWTKERNLKTQLKRKKKIER